MCDRRMEREYATGTYRVFKSVYQRTRVFISPWQEAGIIHSEAKSVFFSHGFHVFFFHFISIHLSSAKAITREDITISQCEKERTTISVSFFLSRPPRCFIFPSFFFQTDFHIWDLAGVFWYTSLFLLIDVIIQRVSQWTWICSFFSSIDFRRFWRIHVLTVRLTEVPQLFPRFKNKHVTWLEKLWVYSCLFPSHCWDRRPVPSVI